MKKIKNLTTNTIEDYTEELEQKLADNNIDYEIGYICNDCGDFIKEFDEINVYTNVGTTYKICENCINNSSVYFYCDDCDTWYDDTVYSYETQNGNTICVSCRDNNYVECDNCNEIVHRDDYHYCDECDLCFCESCWYDHSHDDGLYDYHDFNDWQLQQLPEEPTPDFYIGHELEIDDGYDRGEAASYIYQKLPCICMHDGSLNNNGIEIISHPLSYEYMLSRENDYKSTFDHLVNMGYRSHNTDTCGLHFHVTRPSDEVIDRIILFMETYKEEIITFSRRNRNEISSWCNFLSDKRYDTNEKQIKSLDYIKKYKETSSRYMALNLTNYNTIEFRIFKGTLKYETFMACFEFVYFLTKLASNLEIPIEELTWEKVISNGRFLQNYINEHNLHTNKPIHDYTQDIIIEKNREREEVMKELMVLYKKTVKKLHNLTKIDKRKALNTDNLINASDLDIYTTWITTIIKDLKYVKKYSDLSAYDMESIKNRIKYIKERIDL